MNFQPSKGFNEAIPMTRRYPDLPQKVLRRDSIIAHKIITAWDRDKDEKKVLSIFLTECKNLSAERYWELMRTVWVTAGTVDNADTFRKLMRSPRKQRHYFSTPEEAAIFRAMPEHIAVYRATNDANDRGLSWTTSREYAEFYRNSYEKSIILERIVARKDCFAYINRLNEFEVIIL